MFYYDIPQKGRDDLGLCTITAVPLTLNNSSLYLEEAWPVSDPAPQASLFPTSHSQLLE